MPDDRQRLIDLIADLVAIDSVNPGLQPGAAGEAEIARYIAAWLERAGLEVALEACAPGRPNVVGRVRGTRGGPTVMLNGHTDTVDYIGMDAPLTPRIVGNRLYGRGAWDMKGPLAAAMVAAARLAANPPAGDVLLTAVVDEEFASIGTEGIAARHQAAAAIIAEPTDMELCIAHRGFLWLEVTTHGRAAHGSRPEIGRDAITRMGPVLTGLAALDARLRAGEGHPLLGPGSVHAGTIAGGTGLSTYPESCTVTIERRTIPGETRAQVEGEIIALLDAARAADPEWRGEFRTTFERPPFEVAPDAAIVRATRAAATTVLGAEPPLIGIPAWMDSAILDAVGIPSVIIGPRGEGAHALEEWVDLEDCVRCVDIYEAAVRGFQG